MGGEGEVFKIDFIDGMRKITLKIGALVLKNAGGDVCYLLAMCCLSTDTLVELYVFVCLKLPVGLIVIFRGNACTPRVWARCRYY